MKKTLFFLVVLSILPGTGMMAGRAPSPTDLEGQAALPSRPSAKSDGLISQAKGNSAGLRIDFGSLPLYFTANRGQVDNRALFYAKTSRYTLWLTEEGLIFDSFRTESRRPLSDGKDFSQIPGERPSPEYKRDVSRLVFLGAGRHPEIVPVDATPLKVNYFIGNDPERWHTAVPTSGAVLYKNIYDRIDLKVYGLESRIEYDWIVRPGGNPRDIRVQYENVKGTRLDKNGNLLVDTAFGELTHKRPEAYQKHAGAGPDAPLARDSRMPVPSAFKPIGENAYGFEIGAYDASVDLVIDPVVLTYSTFLGGNGEDIGYAIAVGERGVVYVTGQTASADFPRMNAYQNNRPGIDVFVTKLDTTQSGDACLLYSTYLGGNGTEEGWSIAIDDASNAYVGGRTYSANFPTRNQYQNYRGGGAGEEGFITRLDTSQSGAASLVYSTYLGGSGGGDMVNGIATDGAGNAYATGYTYCGNFPFKLGYQMIKSGGSDVFVTVINTGLVGAASLVYSTFLGGSDNDGGSAIALDSAGVSYIAAYTYASGANSNFPLLNPYQTLRGGTEALVIKLDTRIGGMSGLLYSTCLGGTNGDVAFGIAADVMGHVYVTGVTSSSDFPVLNAFQPLYGGAQDAFVTKLTMTYGPAYLEYSTFLGGGAYDLCRGLALDSSGNISITGSTQSSNFPIKNQYQSYQGGSDAFVAKIDPSQTGADSLVYSTYLGANGNDGGVNIPAGIAVDSAGSTYVTGETRSAGFPDLNAYQTYQGSGDVFVSKIQASTDVSVAKTTDNLFPNVGELFHFTVTATNIGAMPATWLQVADVLPAGLSYQSSSSSHGSYDSGSGIWTIPSLAAEGSATLTIAVVGTTPGAKTNTASVSALNEIDTDSTNNSATATVTLRYVLTIVAGAGGTTNPAPGMYPYDPGAVVSISAGPAAGYRFGSWSGDASGTANPVSVTMDANKTVTANFVRQYRLTVAAGAGGTTSPAPGDYLYDEGAPVSITATPAAGYRFGSWSGAASGTTSPVSITMDADKTVTANFVRQYRLTVAAGAGGTTSPVPGDYLYDEGTPVNIAATPAAGYRFGSWSGDASGTTSPVSVTMNADKTVTANFIRQYRLTVVSGVGGTTSPIPGDYLFDEGTPVSVAATPAAGYRFGSWSGDASGTTSPVSVTMNADKTVTANFIRQYRLTVVSGVGGTTSPLPGDYIFDEGAAAGISATPSAGYRFGSWSGDASGTTSPVSVIMNADKTVTANFVRQYRLTVIAGAGGTTSPLPGDYIYDEGAAAGIFATPSAGYRFGSWSGDASGTTSPVSVTMDADKTVIANFIRQYRLTVAAGAGGTTNPPPGDYLFDEGAGVSIAATPAAGYRFISWGGDIAGTANPISINMDADKMVTANFIRQYRLTIEAGEGGTTSPAPGSYFYDEGAVASIQAIPAAGFRLDSWSGDAAGSANPLNITMNADKAVRAVFIKALGPPLELTGVKLENRNVSMVEYLIRLGWQPNPTNTGVEGYRVYQIDGGAAVLIANVGSGSNEYILRRAQRSKTYRFGVTAFNGLNWESDMAQVVVR